MTFSRARLVRMTISIKYSYESRAVIEPRHSGKHKCAEYHSESVILLNIMLVSVIMMNKLIFFLMLNCYMDLYICASSQCHSGEYTSAYRPASECHSAQCRGTCHWLQNLHLHFFNENVLNSLTSVIFKAQLQKPKYLLFANVTNYNCNLQLYITITWCNLHFWELYIFPFWAKEQHVLDTNARKQLSWTATDV
jgi:hypothetical protein